MKTRFGLESRISRALRALPLLLTLFAAKAAYAANSWSYYLQAGVTQIPAGMYNGSPVLNPVPAENVLMWGYAQCTDATFSSCGAVSFPGPVLVASEGDTLNIYVKNNLIAPAAFPSMLTEPTSLIIPGETTALTPVWVSVNATGRVTGVTSSATGLRPPGDLTSRVRSFTTEVAVGGAAQYIWSQLKPGTFLYQSGTHPAVQAQMGLYGALKVYPAATPALPGSPVPTSGQAYGDPSTAFRSEVTLLFSEIDPELHYSIASGLYGTPPPAPPTAPTRGQRTSTVSYRPKFFLINGLPSPNLLPLAQAGQVGKPTLIRFLNAGLKEKTPTLLSPYLQVVAEDGNPYTYASQGVPFYTSRQQYSVLLPAGKTIDAILTPVAAGALPVFDRSLNLSNGGLPTGGQLAYLSIAAPAALPLLGQVGFSKPGRLSPLDFLLLRSPSSGASWRLGTVHPILWSSTADPGYLRIDLLKGGRPLRTLTRSTAGRKGFFYWSIPRHLAPARDYSLAISGTKRAVVSSPFTLSARPSPVFWLPFW